MVRRTRNSIIENYQDDLKAQNLKFPDVKDPKPIIYHFNKDIDEIFNKTLKLIANELKFSRYRPLSADYYAGSIELAGSVRDVMGKLMKILLVKRLESSFFAFKKTIERFIYSYKRFIEEYKEGYVYISKKYINRVFEFLENDDQEAIQKMIEEDKVSKHSSKEFKKNFIRDLENDYNLLMEINEMWEGVNEDPKLEKFIELLEKDDILKKNKLLIFTESKETAKYLKNKLSPKCEKVMTYSSHASEHTKIRIIENYDANFPKKKQKDDIRILISTDILSEGVSLHRSNVVINYDIPWNPVRMMQRVGRVNRVSKNPPFSNIYTYNFFPAGPIEKNISLEAAAESKIKTFIEMLGNDAKLLTDEDIVSHDLFMKLTSKKLIIGEDEEEDSEIKYLKFLRNIRDNDKKLFERIKRLPKKARTARKYEDSYDSVLTFFRKGKLRKIFQTKKNSVEELDFFKAAKILEAKKNTKKEKLQNDFYKHLQKNKKEFNNVFVDKGDELKISRGKSHESNLIKIIKAINKTPEFTDDDEDYLGEVLRLLKEGGIAKSTIKKISNKIENEDNPLRILATIRANISSALFLETFTKSAADISGPKEVILSEYLVGK